MKDECDINRILKKYQKDGILRHVSRFGGRYEDLPDSIDYQESLNAVMAAEAAFLSLPSSVRSRFENDPGRFLAFVGDPANENEMIDLGLATRREVSPPSRAGTPSLRRRRRRSLRALRARLPSNLYGKVKWKSP